MLLVLWISRIEGKLCISRKAHLKMKRKPVEKILAEKGFELEVLGGFGGGRIDGAYRASARSSPQ